MLDDGRRVAVSGTIDEAPRVRPAGLSIAPWMMGWALGAVILLAMFGADALNQTFREPDSAMRLVQVRDLLGGQGWFDLTQYRLNPPEGAQMHWARWVDAAIAAAIALLSPIIGAAAAEVFVAFAWPLAWLAAFVFLMTRIAGEFVSGDSERTRVSISTAIVAAMAFPALDRFAPGAFDHHNVELVLVATAIWSLIRMDRKPQLGAAAGAALGLAMATAAEGAPFLAVGAVVAGMLWLLQPGTYARGLFWFGVGVGVATAASFVVLVPPSQWSASRCDAMSTSFLSIGAATSYVAIVLGRALPARATGSLALRMVCATVSGGVAGGALLLAAPACLGGGYGAVGPEMMTLWMAQVSEARPLMQLLADNIALFFAVSGAAIVGLVFAAVMVRRRPDFAPGWIVGAFLLAGVVIMVWQIRGAAFATAFAIPFGGYTVARAHAAYRAQVTPRALLQFGAVALVATAAAWGAIGQQVQKYSTPATALRNFSANETGARACFDGPSLRALDNAPPGLILNQFAIGSGVLAASRHAVLAAPYHRNAGGTLAAINAFRSSPDVARELTKTARADYVLVCDGLPEGEFYIAHPAAGDAGGETLAYALANETPPDWLEPVDIGESPLRLFRVVEPTPELRGRF